MAHLPNIKRSVKCGMAAAEDEQDCAGEIARQRFSHITPAYKRALWIVVLLNLGYGVVETIGGFLAASQALKADALDFLGDGAITFLGLAAIGWSTAWRARSALVQGLFLGALGLGVIGAAIYRLFVVHERPAIETKSNLISRGVETFGAFSSGV